MDTFFKKNTFFWISIGAFPGALLRWQTDEIFLVNCIGCFLLGFLNSLNILKRYKLILGFGFCGSLTTFSGWSANLYELISKGSYKMFLLNSIFFVFIALLAVGLGHMAAKKLNTQLVK